MLGHCCICLLTQAWLRQARHDCKSVACVSCSAHSWFHLKCWKASSCWAGIVPPRLIIMSTNCWGVIKPIVNKWYKSEVLPSPVLALRLTVVEGLYSPSICRSWMRDVVTKYGELHLDMMNPIHMHPYECNVINVHSAHATFQYGVLEATQSSWDWLPRVLPASTDLFVVEKCRAVQFHILVLK